MYTELKLDRIVETLAILGNRIEERFPGSGLGKVAGELHSIATDTKPVLEQISRPNFYVRILVALAVTAIAFLLVAALRFLPAQSLDVDGVGALLEAVEAAAQNVIFLAIAIYFLITVESRLNRRVSLRALRRLRSIVHIVDMHQLTKDPEHLRTPGRTTASSPARKLSHFELVRYLEYCSELLSLSSKLAALHAQRLNDSVVLDAVNDIEVLASNLSSQIWQKIMILDTAIPPVPAPGNAS